MAEFGSSEQELLRALGDEDEPSQADRERVGRRLEAELALALGVGVLGTGAAITATASGGAVTGGAATGSTATAATSSLWGSAALLKWAGGSVLVGALALGALQSGLFQTHQEKPLPRAAVSAPTTPAPGTRAQQTPNEAVSPPAAPEAAAPPPTDSIQPTPPATAARPATRASSVDDLEGELTLIGDAQRALSSRAPALALRALETHAERFPSGALRVERAALTSIALCQAGRQSEGAAAAARFAAAHPASPLLQRVQKACGLSSL